MTRRLLLALSLVTLCSAPLALYAQGKTVRTAGIVKTVSDTSLTITASGGKEMTFTMDSTTRFKGKGLGTKSQEGKLTPGTRDRRGRSRECRLQGHVRHAARHPGDGERQGADNEAVNGRGDGSRDVAPATSRAGASGELWAMWPRIQRYLRG